MMLFSKIKKKQKNSFKEKKYAIFKNTVWRKQKLLKEHFLRYNISQICLITFMK